MGVLSLFEDPIFLIHDPAIKHEFNLDDNIKYFSYNQLKSHQFKLYEIIGMPFTN